MSLRFQLSYSHFPYLSAHLTPLEQRLPSYNLITTFRCPWPVLNLSALVPFPCHRSAHNHTVYISPYSPHQVSSFLFFSPLPSHHFFTAPFFSPNYLLHFFFSLLLYITPFESLSISTLFYSLIPLVQSFH